MTVVYRRFVMCPPDHVQPVVRAYLRRCGDCPTRVWVAVPILPSVTCGDVEALCFSCAHRVIRLSAVDPAVGVLPQFVRALEESGRLDWVRGMVENFQQSRAELEAYAAQMERMYS